MRCRIFVFFLFLTTSCPLLGQVPIKIDSMTLLDEARSRRIPLQLYWPEQTKSKLKLAILSHGYKVSHTAYTFIATNLAERGYYVASILHELPGDEPIPTTGKPYEVRMPNWQRGAATILYTLQSLQKQKPDLDFKHVLLVGHSNGGDMSMLFAQQYPELVSQVISLDNRRMPLPRSYNPRILSIRSSDQPADPGVLPTREEQGKYKIRIVTLANTIHNDMCDEGTQAQKEEINTLINSFIR